MIRTALIYASCLIAFAFILKTLEYKYFVRDWSLEFYLGLVAALFAGIGIWAGLRLTRKKVVIEKPPFKFNHKEFERLGISARELEVLGLMADGLSNQEIADKLFVSLSTIKTHASNVLLKLDAKRRTQAVQKAKELQFIP